MHLWECLKMIELLLILYINNYALIGMFKNDLFGLKLRQTKLQI